MVDADVLLVYRRFESNDEFSDAFHGTAGALKVTRITDPDPVSSGVGRGRGCARDRTQRRFQWREQDGTGLFQVTQHRGMPLGSAEAYLAPAGRRPNLTVWTNTLVTRILTEGGRAVGVEVSDRHGHTRRINAHAEVMSVRWRVQYAGVASAFGYRPSGVPAFGGRATGRRPAGGRRELMEHPLVYITCEPTGGHVGIADVEKPKYLAQWMIRRSGKMTSNVAEAGAHVRTDASMPAPNFQCLFAAPASSSTMAEWRGTFRRPPSECPTSAPRSRGTVRIRSNDPRRKPRVAYNMLSTRSEMDEMIDAVELAREIAAAGPARSVLAAEITPGNDVRTGAKSSRWIRTTVQHTYHPSCTARIGTPQGRRRRPAVARAWG